MSFSRTSRVLVLAATALLLVGATAGPASAQLQLGLQDDALLTSGEPQAWPLVQQLGPKVIRFNVAMEQVAPTQPTNQDDPSDPAYDFSRVDEMARQAALNGTELLISIVNGAAWANGNRAPAFAPDPASYGRFCGVVATRYSGSFTPLGQTDPLPQVVKYTVGNEPNRAQYFMPQGPNGATAAKNFANLVKTCVPAIKTASPSAIVAPGPIASRRDKVSGGSAPLAFLKLYKKAGGPAPEVLAYNPYLDGLLPQFRPKEKLADGGITLRNLDQLERWLKKAYGRTVPLWFTEFAWRTAVVKKLGNVTPARQAALTKQTVQLIRRHYPYAQLLVWFLLRDVSPTSYWKSGLVTYDWQQKPAFAIYRSLAAQP